eukprot:scaffold26777_cov101-Isochrysis_galbana.AAC.4
MMQEFRQRGIRLEAARPGRDAWSAHLTLLKLRGLRPSLTCPVRRPGAPPRSWLGVRPSSIPQPSTRTSGSTWQR